MPRPSQEDAALSSCDAAGLKLPSLAVLQEGKALRSLAACAPHVSPQGQLPHVGLVGDGAVARGYYHACERLRDPRGLDLLKLLLCQQALLFLRRQLLELYTWASVKHVKGASGALLEGAIPSSHQAANFGGTSRTR